MSTAHSKFRLFLFIGLFLAAPFSAQAEPKKTNPGALKISATRVAWSNGPKLDSDKVTAGDTLCYTLNISRLAKEKGDVSFSIEAKLIFPESVGRQNELTLPPMHYTNQVFSDPENKSVKSLCSAGTEIVVPVSTPKTDCTVELKVFDHVSGKTSTYQSTLKVEPCEKLSIFHPCLCLDPAGKCPISGNLTLGQRVLVCCILATPEQPPADRIGKVYLEIRRASDDALIFSAKPESLFGSTFKQKGIEPVHFIVARFHVLATQTGKYNVRLFVQDNDKKEIVSQTFPIVVRSQEEK